MVLTFWLVFFQILTAHEISYTADLKQLWVNDSKDDLAQSNDSNQNEISSKSIVSAIPEYEEIGVDTSVPLLPLADDFLTQISEDFESDEYYLAQRGLLNRTEASLRQIVTPENSGRSNSNARIAYYEWLDPNRKRAIPVKIYYPLKMNDRCPTILFSHGLGGSFENCAYLGEYWASNGYISVFIHHYGSDDSVWKGKLRPLNELRNAYDSNWTGRTRVQDILFVLSQLEKLSEQQADLPISLIDKKRIGVAGYDLGALASLVVVGQQAPEGYTLLQNPQIKAVLAMSPPIVNADSFPTVYGRIETPCLFITGTRDDGIIGTTQAAQRRIPFDSISCNDQYLVTFEGTDHQVYAGHLLPILPRVRNDAQYQHSIARLSTNFWNAYLKEDPKALEFMMSRNVAGLLDGLGRIERKFYLRERRDASSEERRIEGIPTTTLAETQEVRERERPQYLSVPQSPYLENYSPAPRQLRDTSSLSPRKLQGRLP